ncbi:ATP-binding protein [Nonomuraea sp. LPB2021202275-12-8]|uniref:ATP-binding protein n=1 Tax=Nonomuraea sp. LPB2021202275-12-8 TaxID=3120159 RepID=UPI00300D3AB5
MDRHRHPPSPRSVSYERTSRDALKYFGIAELLTNAVKHAHASRARIFIARDDTGIVVDVEDDGRGGAGVRADGGLAGLRRRLAGLRRRLAVFDGTLEITSPSGGPTSARMMVPCASLWPRTFTSCVTE